MGELCVVCPKSNGIQSWTPFFLSALTLDILSNIISSQLKTENYYFQFMIKKLENISEIRLFQKLVAIYALLMIVSMESMFFIENKRHITFLYSIEWCWRSERITDICLAGVPG